ncbi:unnamed protein product [Cylindrotheca closterium]|uniref:GH16 domain-containing protein n=1 Tax=Cylindrotheca closterium TaxID=2856 RepID=A0AAD2FNL8_9STRA|nr:unnamed protein product [Cylindrotheca closterium]
MSSSALLHLFLVTATTFLGSTSCHAAQLIFADEFDVPGPPDPLVWSYDKGDWGWGNAELQRYTDDSKNVQVQNGKLVIRAHRVEDAGRSQFTSARIKTLNKVTFQYGRVEAFMKMPDLRNGLWPAFWTLGNDFPIVGWPACGEIDIMEMGHSSGIQEGTVNRKVGSAAHWEHEDDTWANYFDYYTAPSNLNDGSFHNYTLNWTPKFLETYVDGTLVWKMDISHPNCPADKCSEFHKPHFFLLNLAIGGRYTDILTPSGITAPFPAELQVDYVRLYTNQWTHVGGSYFGENEGSYELVNCGCPTTCTDTVLNRSAPGPEGTFSCRERIEWVISNLQLDEKDACAVVGNEFPDICGADCNSMTCPKDDLVSTPIPTATREPTATTTTTTTTPAPVPNPPGPPGPPSSTPKPIDCGCPNHCTARELDQVAGGFTCRARIQWLMDHTPNDRMSEKKACFAVSEEFPSICGRNCNLFHCDLFGENHGDDNDNDNDNGGNDSSSTNPPLDSTNGNDIEERKDDQDASSAITCGCASCNDEVLNRSVGDSTCLERITSLMETQHKSELEACRLVGEEFPKICGGEYCNPDTCTMDCSCGSNSCQSSILNRLVMDKEGTQTCRDRIHSLVETTNVSVKEACGQVSDQFPSVCGQGCHPESCSVFPRTTVRDCGCPGTCLDRVLDQDAAGPSCRDRINWVMGANGLGEEDACSLVSDQFPSSCARGCDPRTC